MDEHVWSEQVPDMNPTEHIEMNSSETVSQASDLTDVLLNNGQKSQLKPLWKAPLEEFKLLYLQRVGRYIKPCGFRMGCHSSSCACEGRRIVLATQCMWNYPVHDVFTCVLINQ